MKIICYLLSFLLHALLLLIILHARFLVTIHPEPPRVVVVRVMEPLPPYIAADALTPTTADDSPPTAAETNAAAGSTPGGRKGASARSMSSRSALPFPSAAGFSMRKSPSGTFRLAPVGKSPDPWALASAPGPASRSLRYDLRAFRPGAAPGGDGGSGAVFLLPFDVRERVVADWTAAAIDRIERNWIIPASARLAFAGRVQITLTVERQGRRHALVIDDSTLPEPLTLSALRALEASLPLPPLPDSVAGELFTFTLVFKYNG